MIVRELVNLIGFKINEGQLRAAEHKIDQLAKRSITIGRNMTMFVTAPFVGLNLWIGKNLSMFEQLDIAFATMIGSTEKADKLVKDMLNFAAKTPFEIKNIGPVVKQLLATGSSAEIVLDELKMMGDIASGLSVPIWRIALNFGQVRAQTKLTGREIRDFAVAGIPLVAELAKMMGKTEKQIFDMTHAGEIGFDSVKEAFRRMTTEGGRFENLMAKQVKTLGGMWSNFLDILTLSTRQFEKDLLPMFKKVILFLFDIVSFFQNRVSPTMKMILFWFGAILATIGPLLLIFGGIITLGMGVAKVFTMIAAAAAVKNLTMGVMLLKYILIAAAIAAVIALIALLIEDFILYTKGQKSLFGKILPPWDELKEKIEAVKFAIAKFALKWNDSLESVGRALFKFVQKWSEFWEGAGEGLFKLVKAVSRFQESFQFGVTGPERTFTAAQALRGAPTGAPTVKQINVQSTINTTIPEGTPEFQSRALKEQAEKSVRDTFTDEIRGLIIASPEIE